MTVIICIIQFNGNMKHFLDFVKAFDNVSIR